MVIQIAQIIFLVELECIEIHNYEKRIALIVNTLSNGGAERVLSNLTLGFDDKYDCDIIVNASCVVDYPINGNIISLGMKQSSNRSSIIYQGKAFL